MRKKSLPKFEIYRDKIREYRWRLRASNGLVITDSGQGYHSKKDCRRGILRVEYAVLVHNLEIIDLT